ncbi:sensor histidine kinase [Clostridium mediterraneense]|uniref:sensor histidine kinase n=1 Tax=Clostridium mediterraneense TaxID=1805472 RepID=UPI00082E106A|nr:HAMP domain-containing sensor histidine kinase [Clostridium mediterraneense]
MNIKMKFDPIFKKIFIFLVLIITAIYSLFLFWEYKQLDKVHKEQIKAYQRVVGSLVKEYPEKESEIVSNLIGTKKEDESYGDKILRKYGYTLEMDSSKDSIFKKYQSGYIRNTAIVLLVIIALNIMIVYLIGRYIFKNLEKISNILEKFIKGDYTYDGDFTEEGIISVIASQLNQLGKNISFNYTKLENEKESSKALVTDISHQLKTPLASLSMCNSILEDDELSEEERKEFLEMSNKNINKLHALINSLVNISRLEVAMIKLKPKENNLKDTILRAYNSAYIKARNKDININIAEIKDYIIKHDSKWTEEAIFNVLDNAIKYTEKDGEINIYLEETNNYIKINISDTGIGINKKEFNNIFKRFYRCKENEKNNIEGSGVGLYLTRKILEDQGGSIIVKSKEGEGSKFILFLRK